MIKKNKKDWELSAVHCDNCGKYLCRVSELQGNFGEVLVGFALDVGEIELKHLCTVKCLAEFVEKIKDRGEYRERNK